MGTKYLSENSLPKWLAELAEARRVIAPQREGHVVLPKVWTQGEVNLERSTTAPKAAALPASEVLLRYSKPKNPENLEESRIELDDAMRAEETLLFGFRPCDAQGFIAIDRTYLQGPVKDPYYEARRAALTIVTLACARPDSTCFCHWLGSGPADPAGSDLLLTPVDGGFVLEAVTEKGQALLNSSLLEDGAPKAEAANAARQAAEAALPPSQDIGAARSGLVAVFSDKDFWAVQSDKCLACGACTYLCPTCTCFNVTDEEQGLKGVRLRTWDTCMASHFTRETSGHNPRPQKGQRWRNRAGHKFWHYPALFDGAVSCTGCGRCIRGCPVSLDIRAIILAAAAHGSPAETMAETPKKISKAPAKAKAKAKVKEPNNG